MSWSLAVSELLAREDDRLMAEVKDGNVAAFEALYRRYRARAHRVAWSICHDEGRAEEAVQEAFVSIWRRRATRVPRPGTVPAWLLTAVRYRAIDLRRRDRRHTQRRAREAALEARPAPVNVPEQVVTHERSGHLLELLAKLPAPQREVIALAYFHGLSHSEIAAALGLPHGTVKGRMRLGLDKLRKAGDEDLQDAP
jgi:RNA polymerase sigma-70 factor, ECF subfamily